MSDHGIALLALVALAAGIGALQALDQAKALSGNTDAMTPVYGDITRNAVSGLGALGQSPSFGAGILQNTVNQTQGGLGAGMAGLTATANGANLTGNPYLDAVLGKGMQDSANAVNSQFSAAGRYGSGAHAGSLARELGGLDQQARLSNYQTERGRQAAARSRSAVQ